MLGEREHLDVGRERRQPAPGRAGGQLVAPLAEQPALGHHERAEARRDRGAVRERAAGRDRLAGADLARVDAGADDLQRGDLLLAAEQDRVVGQRAGAGHAHDLAGAGVERDPRAGALERAQLGDRLLGDDAARGGAHAVGAGDGEHAGPALHAAHAHRVLEVSGGLGGQQQRQAALDRGLHRLAEVHHRARLGVALRQRGGAEPALA